MMKKIEVNEQYFEILTSRKDAVKLIEEIKENCVWGDIDNGLDPDSQLFIEYTDGTIVIIAEGEPVKKIRKHHIKTLILEGDWGTSYYNAFPQLDETYTDMPIIRIGIEPNEYGRPIDIENFSNDSMIDNYSDNADGNSNDSDNIDSNDNRIDSNDYIEPTQVSESTIASSVYTMAITKTTKLYGYTINAPKRFIKYIKKCKYIPNGKINWFNFVLGDMFYTDNGDYQVSMVDHDKKIIWFAHPYM